MSVESPQDLEGYRQIIAEILDECTPEERLAGLAPEEIARVLGPEQLARALSESDHILALPDAALRALPASYLETLPADTQARIRARFGA